MKAKFFALLAVVLAVVSCQRDADDLNVAMGGEQEVMLTVSLPEATRAKSAEGFDLSKLGTTYDLRYILEIYRVDANGVVLYDKCQRFVETSDSKTMVFPVRLAPGYNYRIVAWADIVDEGSKADRYYYTEEGLDNVVIKDNGTVNWNAMDETRDAYTGTQLVENFNSTTNIPNMTLTRPFAKVRVVATDIEDIRNVGLEPTTATVEYAQDMYVKYNAVEDKCIADGAKKKKHEYTYADTASKYEEEDDVEYTLFSDYIFVPSTGTAKFTLTVNAAAGVIKENNFNTEISVERNKLTTIKGDVLTTGGNIKVTVNNDLGVKETYNIVDTPEALQEVIKNAEDNTSVNIELGGDIDLGAIAGISSTRAGENAGLVIPAGKSVVLDLKGFTLSYSDETWGNSMIENFGTLTLKGEGTVAYEFAGDADISNSKGNYAIANRGTLVIDGPTVETTASKAVAGEKFSHALYTIQAFSGEFTLESGKIINNNGYAMRQFGASDITINDGEVKGTRALWIQLAGSNANDAPEVNVTVNGGKLIGTGETDYKLAIYSYSHGNDMRNVNITVNDGTIDGDIALTGGKNKENIETVTIKGGYLDGVYSYGDAAKAKETISITGGSFSSLSPIVYLADNCTYTLNSNIENAEPVKFVGNGTLNLNGHNVSAVDTTETSYGLITNNGNLTITGEGTISLSATKESGWSRYSSVISNSTNGILTVGENVTIEHLGGTSMAYGIDVLTNGGNGDSHATVYGTVKSTYRAIRQFLNSDSKMNTLIVKEGAIINSTGGNKAIWMQDTNKKANKGTLTVESGAKVHSVYLDVTEGSTEWPVSVSVAASSLTDQSENKGLYTENIPDGYAVVNENGVWKVSYTCAAKIGNEEYNSLQEAFNVGGEITLLRDVTVAEPVVLPEGKTAVLDLNGKTLAAADEANKYAINNHGTLTIKGNGTVNARGIYNGYDANGNYVTTAKLTIENGTFNAKGTNGGACVFNYGNVDINGGTFESVGGYGLNNQSGAVMTVDDASVRGGIYNSSGCLTVNANVYQHISGRHAIYNWAGSVEVNGGEFDSESGNELILADGENSSVTINGGTFDKTAKSWLFGAATGKNISFVIKGGTHNGYVNMPEGTVDTIRPYGDPIAVMGGTFNFDPTTWVADGYIVFKNNDKTYTVKSSTLEDGAVLDLGGVEYNGTITALGDLTIKGDTKIKTLKAVNGGTITIEDGKTLTLNNFGFGSKDTADAEYEIKGGTIVASYGYFQHGKYALHSNFETGYMYYSYGSDITVYGTFHSQGKGDGLDYVRGKLTIAEGGKSIHDKSLWVGQPASWGAMNASLVIEAGGYVQANSLSVYEGSSLTYSNDADLKYNSVTGTEYITKK